MEGSQSDTGDEEVAYSLDVDLLISRLEKFKTDLERAEADLQKQAGLSSREADDVVAAARFRLELEKQRQLFDESRTASAAPRSPASTSTTPSFPTRSSSLSQKPISQNVDASPQEQFVSLKKRKDVKHLLLSLTDVDVKPQEVQSAQYPTRVASKPSPRLRQDDSPVLSSIKMHNRRTTIADARLLFAPSTFLLQSPTGSVRDQLTPPLPSLSYTTSPKSATSSPRPTTPLFIKAPDDHQIRQELEIVSIREGPMNLTPMSLMVTRRSNIKSGTLELLDIDDSDISSDDSDPTTSKAASVKSLVVTALPMALSSLPSPELKRRKSVWTMFQRKTTVDNILDMYFDEPAPKSPKLPRRQPSRLASFGTPKRKKPDQG